MPDCEKLSMLQLCQGLFPFELFSLFFDDMSIELIVNKSMRYASQKNDLCFSVTSTEIRRFLGILIFTGYYKLPQMDIYWSKDADKART